MRTVTCPYCFATVPREEIAFRCTGRSGRGPGCAPVLDERLAAYTGSTAAASLPPVFPPPARPGRVGPRGGLRGGTAARAECPDCGRPSGRRVCPECHNPLPPAY